MEKIRLRLENNENFFLKPTYFSTISFQCSFFIPPENIRTSGFLMFSGVSTVG